MIRLNLKSVFTDKDLRIMKLKQNGTKNIHKLGDKYAA